MKFVKIFAFAIIGAFIVSGCAQKEVIKEIEKPCENITGTVSIDLRK